jgi:hypothetical protein
MFKVIPNGINRLDIDMSGKLNAEDMKKYRGHYWRICGRIRPNEKYL